MYAIIYPTAPQQNVKTQAANISLTIPQFTEESLLAAPTPMIAVVFVWVVLTGIPKTDEAKRQTAPAASAENP